LSGAVRTCAPACLRRAYLASQGLPAPTLAAFVLEAGGAALEILPLLTPLAGAGLILFTIAATLSAPGARCSRSST
jgi:uncharacterized membrane protein YphA (DoxX/SURF4 family)